MLLFANSRLKYSELYDVPIGFSCTPPPVPFEAVSCFICGRRRVAVTRNWMICFVLIYRQTCISGITTETAMKALLLTIVTMVTVVAMSAGDLSQCLSRCPNFRLCEESCKSSGKSNCNARCQGDVRKCKIECLMVPCVKVCLADPACITECSNKCENAYINCSKSQPSYEQFRCYEYKVDCIKACTEKKKTECNEKCRPNAEKQL